MTLIVREERSNSARRTITLLTGRETGRPLCASSPLLFPVLSPGPRRRAQQRRVAPRGRTDRRQCVPGKREGVYTGWCIPGVHKVGIPGCTRLPMYLRVYTPPYVPQGVQYPPGYIRVYNTHQGTSGFGRMSPGYTSRFGRMSPGYTSLSARFCSFLHI